MKNIQSIMKQFENNKEQVSVKTLASVVEVNYNGYTLFYPKNSNEPFEIVDNETGETKILN